MELSPPPPAPPPLPMPWLHRCRWRSSSSGGSSVTTCSSGGGNGGGGGVSRSACLTSIAPLLPPRLLLQPPPPRRRHCCCNCCCHRCCFWSRRWWCYCILSSSGSAIWQRVCACDRSRGRGVVVAASQVRQLREVLKHYVSVVYDYVTAPTSVFVRLRCRGRSEIVIHAHHHAIARALP